MQLPSAKTPSLSPECLPGLLLGTDRFQLTQQQFPTGARTRHQKKFQTHRMCQILVQSRVRALPEQYFWRADVNKMLGDAMADVWRPVIPDTEDKSRC